MRQVFVSSTSRGMDTVRSAVIGAIQILDDFAPIAMENFGLRAGTPLALCRAKVAEAGVFLGIIGHEYGSCPPDNQDISYTRAEYNEALALGLARLMFVLPVPDGIVPDKRQALFREIVLADGLAVVKEVTPGQCAVLTAAGLHNLPREAEKTAGATLPPRPEIIGRRAEIDRIVAEVTAPRPRPVVILGHAGMGKTTVSRAVLHEPAVVERFGAHRFFAELATADDPEKFRIAVVLALGLDPRGVNFAGALAFLTQSAPALLVLDNLETPLADAASAPAVEEDLLRLAQVEGLALIGSHRGRDAPGGPHWLSLDPLARLSPADSHALLRRWAPAVPEDATQDDLPADLALSDDGARPPRWLRKLLDALGGLPLALELMGRQIGGETSLTLLWAEWRRLGAELLRRPGTPVEGGRLDSLFASLSFSTARLGPEGRRLFALLGRTPSGMAMADIAALQGDAAAEAMRQLRGSGLTEHPPGRLDLLPPVRDHALRRENLAARDAEWHEHYLALARELAPRLGRDGDAEALARLGPELPNIDAAFNAAIFGGKLRARRGESTGEVRDEPSEVDRLLLNFDEIGSFYFRQGSYGVAQERYERLLEKCENGPEEVRWMVPILRANLALVLRGLGRLIEAEAMMRKCIIEEEAQLGEYHPEIARRLNSLALIYRDMHRREDAGNAIRRALDVDRVSLPSDHPDVATHLVTFGTLAVEGGEFATAETCFREALEIDEKNFGAEDPLLANCLGHLGRVLVARGRAEEAVPLTARALGIINRCGGRNQLIAAGNLNVMSRALQALKQPRKATALARRALTILFQNEKASGMAASILQPVIDNYMHLLSDQGVGQEEVEATIRTMRTQAGL